MERKFINFASPFILDDEINEVIDSLRSGWITTGPKVTAFEKDVCEFCGDGLFAAATFSCTSALFLTLKALGIGGGDEVIIPTFTFASTGHVVVHCGGIPVFVDVYPSTLQMDIGKVKQAITLKTKAIIPVHYAGNPVDMGELLAVAREHELLVVEDAAHAIGSEHQGRKIGALSSHATCFSFYATKNLTTAEGGMVVTRDEALARTIKKMTMYGISDAREIWNSRYTKKGHWFYDVEMIGYKANMTDLNAALGIHQLKRLERFNDTRRQYAELYIKELGSTGCQFMEVRSENKCSWHIFPLLLPSQVDRDDFIIQLKERGIGTSVLFRPLHLHTAYHNLLGTKEGDFPYSEDVFNCLVNLPVSPSISMDDAVYVAETVKGLLDND